MLVWNSNQVIEAFIGFGAKEVTIETSINGMDWAALEGISEFARAPGLGGYASNTAVDFKDTVAKHVRINMVSAQGLTGQVGLSEVRFLHIPTFARTPLPAPDAVTDGIDVVLSWQAGREAVSHDVRLSTDRDAVQSEATLIATTSETNYTVDSLLHATTYYWQVVESNEAAAPMSYAGDVWSFTTPQYSALDNFETYSGEEGQEIFLSWLDGYGGDPGLGGSITGYIDAPFLETVNVHSGNHAMPFTYDNDGNFRDIDGNASSPRFSEVAREFDRALDVTRGDAETLVLFFRGDPDNVAAPLYVAITDASGAAVSIHHLDPDAVLAVDWQVWQLPFDTLGSLDLTAIKKISIGLGDKTNPQAVGAGTLFIDDIGMGKL